MTDPSPVTVPGVEAAFESFAGRVVVAAATLVLAVSLVFLAFPGIDLWASRVFFAPGQGFFLHRQIRLNVAMSRSRAFMAEPERDHVEGDAGLQQVHRSRVPTM